MKGRFLFDDGANQLGFKAVGLGGALDEGRYFGLGDRIAGWLGQTGWSAPGREPDSGGGCLLDDGLTLGGDCGALPVEIMA